MQALRFPVRKVRRASLTGLANLLSGTHFFAIKRALLRGAGISVGEGAKVVGPLHIGTEASLAIGAHTWIGHDCSIEGNGSVEIGSNVDIAPFCVFSTGGHSIGTAERRAGVGRVFSQSVGDGSWIGIRSTFVNDVHVGTGCVIAAGSVVVDNIPNNGLAAGVPAVPRRQLPE